VGGDRVGGEQAWLHTGDAAEVGTARGAERGQTFRPDHHGARPDKELKRVVRELKRANEILRKASAYFAQAELDRRPK